MEQRPCSRARGSLSPPASRGKITGVTGPGTRVIPARLSTPGRPALPSSQSRPGSPPRVIPGCKRLHSQLFRVHCEALRELGRAEQLPRCVGGGPGQIRTADLRFRKPLLYPSELRGLAGVTPLSHSALARSARGQTRPKQARGPSPAGCPPITKVPIPATSAPQKPATRNAY